jgi:hypothetical protein
MRSLALVLATLAMLALPAAAADTELGSGHILVGSPTTAVIGIPDVTSLFFATPAAGTIITTSTVDNSGAGYDLDFYFWDAAGGYLSACATEAVDEICEVPAGAAEVEVSAFVGLDLDVTLLAIE